MTTEHKPQSSPQGAWVRLAEADTADLFAIVRNLRLAGWEREVALKRIEEQLEAAQNALADACDVAIWLSALIGGVVDGDSPEVHTTWQESMRPKLFAALDRVPERGVSSPASEPKA